MAEHPRVAASGSDSKLRISKACEECRRRKQKCNGLTPCDVCSRRGSQCRYRGFLRNRATRALIAQRRSENSPPQPEPSEPHNAEAHAAERESTNADDESRPVPHQERIFNNVRATYAAPESPSCLLQLYYGPSSNFSFLQHIHSHLTARRASQSISDDNNDGDQGIDRYKYKGIVFGSASKKRPAISPVFLHYDLAKSFLLNFLSTTHHYLPVLSPARLSSTLEKLYGRGISAADSIEPLDKAALIITLAMGAISTEEPYWRATLLSQARTEAEAVRYHVNVKAVQVALLMAHCEFATGHPNLAYLSLGSAVTKAFAAGMHKSGAVGDGADAQQTMWHLFCNESISCLMLGRPYLLDRQIITIPLAERPSFTSALVRLCTTIRHTHRLYFHPKTSTISNLLHSASTIHRDLNDFSTWLATTLGIRIGAIPADPTSESLSHHVVTSYLYFYTTILAFRPLLLLQIEPRPADRAPELAAAREHCLVAARATVALAESLLSTVPNIQALCNHGYFLESACFVLVLAAATDGGGGGGGGGGDVGYVARGLACLRQLVQREPVPAVVGALERMLVKLQDRAAVPTELEPSVLEQQGGGWAEAGQDGLLGGADGGGGMLEDFELPGMDWGVDFSLLDVEEFVAVMGVQPGFTGGFQ